MISKAKYPILIGGSLADSILSNIVQHGSAEEAVTVASGPQNLRNVTIANVCVVKDADSLGIRGGPPRADVGGRGPGGIGWTVHAIPDVIVHSIEPDGSYGDIFMAGFEAQMIEGGTGDFIVVPGKRADGSRITLSLTAEVVKDRDGESVWQARGERRVLPRGRVNWYGRDPDWKDAVDFRGLKDLEN